MKAGGRQGLSLAGTWAGRGHINLEFRELARCVHFSPSESLEKSWDWRHPVDSLMKDVWLERKMREGSVCTSSLQHSGGVYRSQHLSRQ